MANLDTKRAIADLENIQDTGRKASPNALQSVFRNLGSIERERETLTREVKHIGDRVERLRAAFQSGIANSSRSIVKLMDDVRDAIERKNEIEIKAPEMDSAKLKSAQTKLARDLRSLQSRAELVLGRRVSNLNDVLRMSVQDRKLTSDEQELAKRMREQAEAMERRLNDLTDLLAKALRHASEAQQQFRKFSGMQAVEAGLSKLTAETEDKAERVNSKIDNTITDLRGDLAKLASLRRQLNNLTSAMSSLNNIELRDVERIADRIAKITVVAGLVVAGTVTLNPIVLGGFAFVAALSSLFRNVAQKIRELRS